MIQAFENVLAKHVVWNKLWNLIQKVLVEAYATKFLLFCAQITNLDLSVDEKSIALYVDQSMKYVSK